MDYSPQGHKESDTTEATWDVLCLSRPVWWVGPGRVWLSSIWNLVNVTDVWVLSRAVVSDSLRPRGL